MKTAIVSSVIANKPLNGGNAWAVLSWLLGLKKLGFRTYFLEQIEPRSCVDASGRAAEFEESVNLAYFKQVIEQFGLAGSAALIYDHGEKVHGLTYRELLDIAEASDLLVNITGHLSLEPIRGRIGRKAYVDFDPGFTQFWHAAGSGGPRLPGHDFYFTVGENVGTPACPIPTDHIHWRPIRQPVVLEHWPVSSVGDRDRFTTVASWRGAYGPVRHAGKTFGLKVHEFRRFIEIPKRARQTFEIALDIHPAEERDLYLLRRNGWKILDPKRAVPDPLTFRRYVQESGAEFSVAQGVYVETGSGWFSDRTVRYLASGKPALVEDTGFSRNLPVGEGLLAFRTTEEAMAGVERIAGDYDKHCRAARSLAEEYFDSNKVLGRFIQEVGIAP